MSKTEIPEQWRKPLETKGVTAIRGLATRVGISPMTASRLLKGEGTSPSTVNRVADELFEGDRDYVWRLYGLSVRDYGRFDLPEESSLLTEDQRQAVLAVVRAMLPPEVKVGGASVKRAAANTEDDQEGGALVVELNPKTPKVPASGKRAARESTQPPLAKDPDATED